MFLQSFKKQNSSRPVSGLHIPSYKTTYLGRRKTVRSDNNTRQFSPNPSKFFFDNKKSSTGSLLRNKSSNLLVFLTAISIFSFAFIFVQSLVVNVSSNNPNKTVTEVQVYTNYKETTATNTQNNSKNLVEIGAN